MAAHQATLSLGFSRQEYWSGLPFSPPVHESEYEVTQSRPTLRDPMDCIPPGSPIHGIYQARVLEWGALAFSNGQLTVKQNSFGKPYFILLFGIVIFVLVSLTLSTSPNNCVHFLTKILDAKDSVFMFVFVSFLFLLLHIFFK